LVRVWSPLLKEKSRGEYLGFFCVLIYGILPPVFQDHLFSYSSKFLFIDCRERIKKLSFAVI
ncbi:hypothetical protein, partial [Sphingobacterium sp.]|uniref:hypothetical protein n=1 Tax=Sphingobacterium sp. TaxID=341027 RepID=UPI0031DE9FE6